MNDLDERIRHTSIPGDGVRLHVVEAGPAEGPPVVLLHGFPEFWYGWKHQIGPLASAGFHVVVPDQRGYAESEKPRPVSDYGLDALTEDVVALLESLKITSTALVGHDWGGAVAWWLAVRRPDLVRKLVVINSPHPNALREFLVRSPKQLLKGWYSFYFQLPWLPERLLKRGRWKPLTSGMRTSSRPGTFSDADFDYYRNAWSQPGAMAAMINWYRAAIRVPPESRQDVRVHVPTLLIWGAQDQFLERGLTEASLAYCDHGTREFIEEATHWVQHEEPDRVNRLLLDFLQNEPRPHEA